MINVTKGLIKLTECECIPQDDKEILMNIVDDTISRRRELYELVNRKPVVKSVDQSLLKSYESFIDLVQNFKTC